MKGFGIVVVASVLVAACTARVSPPTSAPASLPTVTPVVGRAVPALATVEPTVTPVARAAAPTIEQLIGQKLVVSMEGATPSAGLLARIRRGEVGGVILFRSNITTRAALGALIQTLRDAAAAGGQPPPPIAADQEGGAIRRIPWAPPTLSAPQLGRAGRASMARTQGASTGAALRGLGINVD